jgi:formate--tetrahydrofolate ligase
VHAVDTAAELAELEALLTERGIACGAANVFGEGGAGALSVCEKVLSRADQTTTKTPRYVYELTDPPVEKIRKIATTIYGADSIEVQAAAKASLERAGSLGFAEAPVCMAKTHLSLSDDDKRVGRPQGFKMTIRDVRVSGGAGFLVALTGELMTMPGLPKQPASIGIDLTDDGEIIGVK